MGAYVLFVAMLTASPQHVEAGKDGKNESPGASTTPTPVPTMDVEVIFWNSVKDSDDPELLQTYLDRYPAGAFAPIAKLKIERLNAPPLTPSGRVADEPTFSGSESYGRQEVLRVTLGGSGSRGVLGLRGQTLDAFWQIAIGPEAKGAIVVEVLPGGAAEQVRLRRGDIVTRVEGQDVAAMADVARLIGQAGPGKQVAIQIWRPDGDYKTLVARLAARADKNDAPAALALAEIYRLGLLGREDVSEALKWQHKAAETGSTVAMFVLGTTLAASQGPEKEKELSEAVQWFRKASEAGDPRAMHALGVMYDNGFGTSKDAVEAVRWFRKGSDAGNAAAMAAFAQMQLNGRGTIKDETAGVALMRKAADAGNPTAMAQLGAAYAEGKGLPKDETEAVRWYRRATDAGYTAAFYHLGLAYHYGRGVPKDQTEALRSFRWAADNGLTVGMVALGDIYANAIGTAKDDAEATRWYRKAADAGDTGAMYTMAIRSEFGLGVARDTEGAAQWAIASVKGGSEYARTQLIAEADKWSPDFRRTLQRKLKDAGHYTGDIDGRMGAGVKDALDRLAKSGTKGP
ncbi:MAG: PDZ domain-containing protein [Hyphomicrobium sp.]|uniref:PDZ domain-containing protein n=1 Tax=Hyphomicrobium sp. TaxID=82 RepID=UPI001321814E|nr:PDZ domain-containing protein [Hyphomicrobium sp.]KAB2941414.1 MAG: PDZ domain-containing protein [Hyphomicrobium sp.]MBZ0212068.1 PDZ domain-containing protein [Hyphomicrobium sp.]